MGVEAEMRFKKQEEVIKQLTKTLKQHASLIALKAENADLMKFESQKVDKEEFLDMIPDIDINREVKAQIGHIPKQLDELQKAWDHKIIRLRADVDLHSVKKQLGNKLDERDFRAEKEKTESDIKNIEEALIRFTMEIDSAN